MLPPFLRWDVLFYLVGEKDDTGLVVVLDGTECQCRSNLRHHIALHLVTGAEVERAADINQQHHRQLALLLKHLYIRAVEAGRDVPVYVAHIVAELVVAHFAECHAAPLESRMVLPGKDV